MKTSMADAAKIFGKGTAFPPHIGENGRWAWSQGEDNIRENIRIILLTEPGERLMLPEFGGGLKRFLFEPNTVSTRRLIEEQILQSLARWERRIKVQSVSVEEDPEDGRKAIAGVRYQLVATQAVESVSLSVSLAG